MHLDVADSEDHRREMFGERDSNIHSLKMTPPQFVLGSLADLIEVHPIEINLQGQTQCTYIAQHQEHLTDQDTSLIRTPH